jgi:hypothetical protein
MKGSPIPLHFPEGNCGQAYGASCPSLWLRSRRSSPAEKPGLLVAIVTIATVCVLLARSAYGTEFYVDSSVAVSGNGATWSSAWKSFADIAWPSIKPGSRILVSGGTSGRVYLETLTVGASGRPGAPIVISSARDAGHDGVVVIDGENTRPGVIVSRVDHVVVTGLFIRNAVQAGIAVRSTSAGVVLEGNHVLAGDAEGNARGYDVRESAGAVVRGNSYATPTTTPGQTDGIWSSGNNDVVFERNRLVISNDSTEGHSDGVQSYQDRNIVVRGNWIEQSNAAPYNNHGIWMSDTRAGGTITVYCNVVLTPNLIQDSAVTHWAAPGWSEVGAVRIWNNTIVGGGRSLNLDKSPNAEVKNNIIWPARGGIGIYVVNARLPTRGIQSNLIWAPGARIAVIGGNEKSWIDWLVFDPRAINADPRFVDLQSRDVTLATGSPARGRGSALPELTTDCAGDLRRPRAALDVGASGVRRDGPFSMPPPPSPGSPMPQPLDGGTK